MSMMSVPLINSKLAQNELRCTVYLLSQILRETKFKYILCKKKSENRKYNVLLLKNIYNTYNEKGG